MERAAARAGSAAGWVQFPGGQWSNSCPFPSGSCRRPRTWRRTPSSQTKVRRERVRHTWAASSSPWVGTGPDPRPPQPLTLGTCAPALSRRSPQLHLQDGDTGTPRRPPRANQDPKPEAPVWRARKPAPALGTRASVRAHAGPGVQGRGTHPVLTQPPLGQGAGEVAVSRQPGVPRRKWEQNGERSLCLPREGTVGDGGGG